MVRLEHLIAELGPERLQLLSPDIRALINRFYPKRKRDLHHYLAIRLGKAPVNRFRPLAGVIDDGSPTNVRADYARRLDALRDHHIFQWSTHYRETIHYVFRDLLQRAQLSDSPVTLLRIASAEFDRHSASIFRQGFEYITQKLELSPEVAEIKSINGLQRFLLLLVQEHTSLARDVKNAGDSRGLRNACSALLTGVLSGYAALTLRGRSGWSLLQSNLPLWAHTLAFLRGSDLEKLIGSREENLQTSFRDLQEILVPILLALDRFFERRQGPDYVLTRVSRFFTNPLRLEFSLALPARATRQHLTLVSFFGGPYADQRLVDDAINAGANMVCLRMTTELRSHCEDPLDGRILDATVVGTQSEHSHSLSRLGLGALEHQLKETLENTERNLRRVHNYAREFPLEDPVLRRYFLVERHSVKRLLELFEQGTGTHVWCSVRRSGKTTAAVDLAGVSERSVVAIQTMDQQPQQRELNILYEQVVAAIQSGRALASSFFGDIVRDCVAAVSPNRYSSPKRVLVIDEYESLFGHLEAAVRQDDALRYTVVQPLLSQMVAFSVDNLLILLGQRPDAHCIVMSQNQLSPLVRQDAFPLFEHQAEGSDTEFTKFLSLVLSPKIPFGPSFTDAVYGVTAGHPYLTVNLLVDFCQWLVENNTPADGIRLTRADFGRFADERLTPAALRSSSYYGFFQRMLAEYLGEMARKREPWLYAVSSVLQRVCREHPRALATSVPKYKEMAGDVAALTGLTPGQLLATASQANFLATDGGRVRPAIPLMGRLAAVAVAEVN